MLDETKWGRPHIQTWKKTFFCELCNFGITDLAKKKKHVNCDKFEIPPKQRKSKILPTCILFLPFDRGYMILPCYLHSIYRL